MNLNVAYESKVFLQLTLSFTSFHQLLNDVKTLYAKLKLLKAKCIAVFQSYFTKVEKNKRSRLNFLDNQKWQNLSFYHRLLLQQYCDYYTTCQHPAGSQLIELIIKNSMPFRMWKYGIANYLIILRWMFSDFSDHMLYFTHYAYSMLTVFSESEAVYDWSSRFDNLANHFGYIEKACIDDHIWGWNDVAKYWYNKAVDKNPNEKSLHYELDKLARPNNLQQLYYYAAFSTCVISFEGVKKHMMNLLTSIMIEKPRFMCFVTFFMKIQSILFWKVFENHLKSIQFINDKLLFDYIGRVTAAFKCNGVFVAITCIVGFFEYGSRSTESKLNFRFAFEEMQTNRVQQTQIAAQKSFFDIGLSRSIDIAWLRRIFHFAFSCLSIALRRVKDMNVLFLIHVYLMFLKNLAKIEKTMKHVELNVPWAEICSFVNALMKSNYVSFGNVQRGFYDNKIIGFLFEDFIIRRQIYGQSYFPNDWFEHATSDDEKRKLKSFTTTDVRIRRILWFASCLVFVRFTVLIKITECPINFW